MFSDYGDDSVAQLGGAHIACEYVSNVLTKVLEWGRLMSYLEQSTRYVPYTDQLHGRWRYHVPAELEAGALRDALRRARWTRRSSATRSGFRACRSTSPRATRARAGDSGRRAPRRDSRQGARYAARPAAGRDAVERRAVRQRPGVRGAAAAHARASARTRCATAPPTCSRELRKVIPAFLTRVDQPDRGGRWSRVSGGHARRGRAARATELLRGRRPPRRARKSRSADFDPDGETKVVAAALYASSALPDDQLMAIARRMSPDDRARVLRAYVGDRGNRRHRPGRAFERTSYRFDVLTDYGAFRDLQRHRLLTLEWQPLTTRHGYTEPAAIVEAGGGDAWRRVMDASADAPRAAACERPRQPSRRTRSRWPTASGSTWT